MFHGPTSNMLVDSSVFLFIPMLNAVLPYSLNVSVWVYVSVFERYNVELTTKMLKPEMLKSLVFRLCKYLKSVEAQGLI